MFPEIFKFFPDVRTNGFPFPQLLSDVGFEIDFAAQISGFGFSGDFFTSFVSYSFGGHVRTDFVAFVLVKVEPVALADVLDSVQEFLDG